MNKKQVLPFAKKNERVYIMELTDDCCKTLTVPPQVPITGLFSLHQNEQQSQNMRNNVYYLSKPIPNHVPANFAWKSQAPLN